MDSEDNDVISSDKLPIFVLHHTYFCDAFISYPNFNFEKFQELKDTRMIYRFLSIAQAHLIEDIAYTTESAYGAFLKSFDKNEHTANSWTVKKHLEGMVDIDHSPTLNELGEDGSIIVKADQMLSLNAKRETSVVISSSARNNFVKKAIDYYKDKLKKKFVEKDIPFKVLDYYNANLNLSSKYSKIYKEVMELMKGEPF